MTGLTEQSGSVSASANSQSASHHRKHSIHSHEGQDGEKQTSKHGKVGIRDRLHHMTWAWYTTTMSTGGIALLIANTPHTFRRLNTIGEIVYILDLVLFVGICSGISARFIMFPKTFMASLAHPTESLFFPTFWLSITTILSCMQLYGAPKTGPWLIVAMRVLFWIYVPCTFLVSVGQYYYLFTAKKMTLHSMTPAWILPVFPVMLSGTLASVIGSSQPAKYTLPILVAGVTFQGLGMLISVFFYSIYLGRLMIEGLPAPNLRPGMFIAAGPPAFTALALLGISKAFYTVYPSYTTIDSILNPSIIPDVLNIIALSTAVFLWAVAFWFFCIALTSVLYGAFSKEGMSFHLVWYALVFPNVGLTISIIKIGQALKSEGVLWVSSVMTVIMIAIWLFVGFSHVKAVYSKKILWPGKDEDSDQ